MCVEVCFLVLPEDGLISLGLIRLDRFYLIFYYYYYYLFLYQDADLQQANF